MEKKPWIVALPLPIGDSALTASGARRPWWPVWPLAMLGPRALVTPLHALAPATPLDKGRKQSWEEQKGEGSMSKNLYLTPTSSLSLGWLTVKEQNRPVLLQWLSFYCCLFPLTSSHPSSKTVLPSLCFQLSAARINGYTPNATEKWKNRVTLDLNILLHVFLADKYISCSPVL